MKYALGHGTTPEHKQMVPDGRAQVPEWTFAATFLFPVSGAGASAPLDRAGQIQHLFGDRMAEYVAGEKRRWELTLKHRNTDFVELDKTDDPLSVNLPSAGGCK